MKLKLNKVDVRKQRRKTILYFAAAVLFFVLLFVFGKSSPAVICFLAAAFCFLEGCFCFVILLIGLLQKRGNKQCVENELSSAQS